MIEMMKDTYLQDSEMSAYRLLHIEHCSLGLDTDSLSLFQLSEVTDLKPSLVTCPRDDQKGSEYLPSVHEDYKVRPSSEECCPVWCV